MRSPAVGCYKRRYSTFVSARRAISEWTRRKKAPRQADTLHVFECASCNGFHVGNFTGRRSRNGRPWR